MTQIDIDKFVDYDFTTDPEFVAGNLGLGHAAELCGVYEDAVPVMTEAQIDEQIERDDSEGGTLDEVVPYINDQRREGSCVSQAFAKGRECLHIVAFGNDLFVPLSPISLYKRIGRSASSGALVSDGIEELTKRGILPLDTPENRAKFGEKVMPMTGFSTPFPQGWETAAALFKCGEYDVVRTTAGLWTALCNRHPVIVGREGHSIMYARATRKGGSSTARKAKYANSWGENWGDHGFGYDTESQVRKSAQWAVVMRSLVVPGKRAP